MVFYVEKIEIELTENQYGLLLKTADSELPLPGQTIEQTIETLQGNFEILKNHYLKTASSTIVPEELNEVCLKIVLHFFGLYNSWKYSNENEKDRDLTFLPKDFGHANTRDILLQYFKRKYPEDYADKCASILDMPAADLLKYEYNNNEFYNSFR